MDAQVETFLNMMSEAERAGRVLSIHHEFREQPIFRAVLDRLGSDDVGRMRFCQITQLLSLAPWDEPAAWHRFSRYLRWETHEGLEVVRLPWTGSASPRTYLAALVLIVSLAGAVRLLGERLVVLEDRVPEIAAAELDRREDEDRRVPQHLQRDVLELARLRLEALALLLAFVEPGLGDQPAAGGGLFQRLRIAKIPTYGFSLQIVQFTGRAHQRSDLVALFD